MIFHGKKGAASPSNGSHSSPKASRGNEGTSGGRRGGRRGESNSGRRFATKSKDKYQRDRRNRREKIAKAIRKMFRQMIMLQNFNKYVNRSIIFNWFIRRALFVVFKLLRCIKHHRCLSFNLLNLLNLLNGVHRYQNFMGKPWGRSIKNKMLAAGRGDHWQWMADSGTFIIIYVYYGRRRYVYTVTS
jgi:hypothetical protein